MHEGDGDRPDAVGVGPHSRADRMAASSSGAISAPSASRRPGISATCRRAVPASRISRSKSLGRACVPIRRRSPKPSVIRRRTRAPFRSRSALVATVVPILTLSMGRRCLRVSRGSPPRRHRRSGPGPRTGASWSRDVPSGRPADDIGEGAATVDPELPLAHAAPPVAQPLLTSRDPPPERGRMRMGHGVFLRVRSVRRRADGGTQLRAILGAERIEQVAFGVACGGAQARHLFHALDRQANHEACGGRSCRGSRKSVRGPRAAAAPG
jgi:hypothetical protein